MLKIPKPSAYVSIESSHGGIDGCPIVAPHALVHVFINLFSTTDCYQIEIQKKIETKNKQQTSIRNYKHQ